MKNHAFGKWEAIGPGAWHWIAGSTKGFFEDPMIAGQVSKPLLSVRSEMNAELRGEDKAATSDSELNEPLLAPVESNDSEDTPSKLFGKSA
uniref:POU class 6 homeobox 2 n=1 Tax=Molossus molossus TaxID=27622 RepID=A0A7J8HCY3_MOLMO|nr:POU class 6 homeobox 2 [Molossus molossus]